MEIFIWFYLVPMVIFFVYVVFALIGDLNNDPNFKITVGDALLLVTIGIVPFMNIGAVIYFICTEIGEIFEKTNFFKKDISHWFRKSKR